MGFARPHFLTETAVMIPAMLCPIGSLREALFSVTFFGEATGRHSLLSFIKAVCRDKGVRFSITVRQHARLRNLIEAIPETDWTPMPY